MFGVIQQAPEDHMTVSPQQKILFIPTGAAWWWYFKLQLVLFVQGVNLKERELKWLWCVGHIRHKTPIATRLFMGLLTINFDNLDQTLSSSRENEMFALWHTEQKIEGLYFSSFRQLRGKGFLDCLCSLLVCMGVRVYGCMGWTQRSKSSKKISIIMTE